MARLKSIASGNWTDAATWGVVDATSHNDSELIATLVTTSYVASSTFTPGAITVDGVAVKISFISPTPTGTISVSLSQGGVTVSGTEVTINLSDLPAIATSSFSGGWTYFKFASPVTLLAATLYAVQVKTSSGSQVNLFAQASSNWARLLVTTTTQAPVAGDDMIIAGGYTGAGTSDTITVVMNETASTDYGSGVFTITGSGVRSLSSYALHISGKGVLTWGTAAATNYILKLSGNLNVYGDGVYNMGTVATPCPRDSTMKLIMDCLANVEIGIMARNGSTFNTQGLSRTSGKNIYYCKLNTDEAIASTSLGVDTDTGWLDNDEIVVASTTRTSAQCEAGTLNGNAGASSITVDGFAGAGGGLAFAHSGTAPTQAEVILLTRNVTICGASATLQTYIDIKPTATVDCDWTQFKWLGSGTTNKRGIDNGATTGLVSFQYCSLNTFAVVNSLGYFQSSAASSNSVFSNNVIWNTAAESIYINATTGTWTCDGNITMNSAVAPIPARLLDVGGTFTNNTFVGGGQGTIISESANITGIISGNTWHSNANVLQFLAMTGGTISNTTVWRNNAAPLQITNAVNNLTIDGLTMFGNSINNLNLLMCTNVTVNNFVSNGDSTFSTPTGVNIAGGINIVSGIRFTNSTFGVASGIKTAHTQDVLCAAQYAGVVFENCLFSSPVTVASQNLLLAGSYISSQKHNQTAGNHRSWFKYGNITIDTTISNSAVPSERLTPNNASSKLTSALFKVAVVNGTTLTPSVTVRKSIVGDGTAYNGNQPRLIVKKNLAIGIAADTVLATASGAAGSWETLSAATASVTDDGILEFYVDCDGTTGWINIDDWSCPTTNDTRGQFFWQDGLPVAYGNNSSGSGGPYKPFQSPVLGGGFRS